jgi:hypothetical protein
MLKGTDRSHKNVYIVAPHDVSVHYSTATTTTTYMFTDTAKDCTGVVERSAHTKRLQFAVSCCDTSCGTSNWFAELAVCAIGCVMQIIVMRTGLCAKLKKGAACYGVCAETNCFYFGKVHRAYNETTG